MRVRLTHFTLRAWYLKSWAVDASVDGRNWTEIARQTNNHDFNPWNTASFAVSTPAEFRFVRLTQTDKNHEGGHELVLDAVEFFGTLSE
jgi:hypothetical protein